MQLGTRKPHAVWSALSRPPCLGNPEESAPWRHAGPTRGPLIVAALALPPIILWALDRPLGSRFEGSAAALASLANIAALLGTAGFAINLLIGARLPFGERCFGPLDRAYRLHRFVGLAALVLVVMHALFITASRATLSLASSLELFSPAASWAVFAGVVALAIMIAAVALTLFGRLRHETFVKVQRSFGLIFIVASIHTLALPGKLDSAPTVYLLVLAAVATASFLYRSVLHRFLVRGYAYRLVGVDRLDPSVAQLSLSPEGRPFRFRPGQFAFFTFFAEAVDREPHPFSIASSPLDPDVRIVVKALGDYTSALMDIAPGGAVKVEGPYGRFSYLDVSNHRQIWIAGGVGITAFLSMARTFDAADYEVDLYYCTEHADQAHFLGELFEIADRDPRFRVVPIRTVSLGHIRAEDILGVSRDLVARDLLLCGPPAMTRTLTAQFRQIGVPSRQIHSEDFQVR